MHLYFNAFLKNGVCISICIGSSETVAFAFKCFDMHLLTNLNQTLRAASLVGDEVVKATMDERLLQNNTTKLGISTKHFVVRNKVSKINMLTNVIFCNRMFQFVQQERKTQQTNFH